MNELFEIYKRAPRRQQIVRKRYVVVFRKCHANGIEIRVHPENKPMQHEKYQHAEAENMLVSVRFAFK